MNRILIALIFFSIISSLNADKQQSTGPNFRRKTIKIILGSTREGRTSATIGMILKNIASTRNDVAVDVIDLREYALPFLNDAIPPVMRKEITDPVIQRWSDVISKADAFIIVVPEYNAGYPGVLKNALDCLYKEWNGKMVGFVGYSGGPSGGLGAIEQLVPVVKALQMKPLAKTITIPTVWKVLNECGTFFDESVEQQCSIMIDTLLNKDGHE